MCQVLKNETNFLSLIPLSEWQLSRNLGSALSCVVIAGDTYVKESKWCSSHSCFCTKLILLALLKYKDVIMWSEYLPRDISQD